MQNPLLHVITNCTFTATCMHFMENSYAQTNHTRSVWAKVEGGVRLWLLYDQLVREHTYNHQSGCVTNDDCQMTIQSDLSETDMIRDVESYRESVGVLLMYVYSYVCRANVGKPMYFTNECAPKKLDQYIPMHLGCALKLVLWSSLLFLVYIAVWPASPHCSNCACLYV